MKDNIFPLIGISCSTQLLDIPNFGEVTYHVVYKKYLEALIETMECIPVFIPAIGPSGKANRLDVIDELLNLLDGVVLTGAISNVDPSQYSINDNKAYGVLDRNRDAVMIHVAKSAIEKGIPILGICRGMQELNVACGGSLFPVLHERDGCFDHRSPRDVVLKEKYRAAHQICFEEGGVLSRIISNSDAIFQNVFVNSLHSQGINKLGDNVNIEARALDGTIEAISVKDAETFCLGVQWHPEWWLESNPLNRAIYNAFSDACNEHKKSRGVK